VKGVVSLKPSQEKVQGMPRRCQGTPKGGQRRQGVVSLKPSQGVVSLKPSQAIGFKETKRD